MPVLPDVASRMIFSRVSAPDVSPSWIIRSAGLSFTEPPGFFHSAFAYSSTLRSPASKVESRISGVLPMRSTMEVAVRGSPGMATGISDWESPDYNNSQFPTSNSQGELPGSWRLEVGSWPLTRGFSVRGDDFD